MSVTEQASWVRWACRTGLARSIRLAAGVTQREVALDVDVSPQTVQRWEDGQRVPSAHRAPRYAEVLLRLQQLETVAS